ncbi:unnamed protein product [Ectocarpus sp. 8 AP-2014]
MKPLSSGKLYGAFYHAFVAELSSCPPKRPPLLTPDRERTGETRGSGSYSAVRNTSDSDGTTLHGPHQRHVARDASPLAVIARGLEDLQPHEGRTQRGGAVKTVKTCAVSFVVLFRFRANPPGVS